MTVMGLFDRAGLPRAVYASLAAEVGGRPRVLAWARGANGPVVGTSDRLAIAASEGWQLVPWHQIASGGWDASSGRLRWTSVDGAEHGMVLDDPGSLPELFRERVDASIVVQERFELERGRAAMIVARRRLDDQRAPLIWSVSPLGGAWSADQTARSAAELARLQAEYDIR